MSGVRAWPSARLSSSCVWLRPCNTFRLRIALVAWLCVTLLGQSCFAQWLHAHVGVDISLQHAGSRVNDERLTTPTPAQPVHSIDPPISLTGTASELQFGDASTWFSVQLAKGDSRSTFAIPREFDIAQESAVDTELLMLALLARNSSYISEIWLSRLDYLTRSTFTVLPPVVQVYLEAFVQTFLFVLAQPLYQPSDVEVLRLLEYNDVISNIVRLTSVRTTDSVIRTLLLQGGTAGKVLVLYNPRCSPDLLSQDEIRRTVPALFGPWFVSWYSMAFSGLAEWRVFDNLLAHQRYLASLPVLAPSTGDDLPLAEQALPGVHTFLPLYFACTYVDDESESAVRQHIGAAVRRMHRRLPVPYRFHHSPRNGSVAVLSGPWSPERTIVHRVYSRYLQALALHYDLTLVQINIPLAEQHGLPPAPFRRVLYVNWYADRTLGVDALRHHDFQLLFFLDIGLTEQSIHLAHLRIAPIQVTGYGHPVSTFGGEIDYFIGSAAAERHDLADRFYSERLVLLRGLGVVHSPHWSAPAQVLPPLDRQFLRTFAGQSVSDEPYAPGTVVLHCPWHGQKINAPLLALLQRIVAASQRPLLFRFFLGSGLSTRNRFLVLQQELQARLRPARVETYYGGMPSERYAQLLGQADAFLDAYPFGGVNTVMDALFLRRPFLCLEGFRWISRVAAAHLRYAGLPELIARTADEYASIALRLIHDDAWRHGLIAHLEQLDLDALFFANGEEQEMVRAVRFLISNHAELQSQPKHPIVIA